jgi:predicted transcriptional regulator
MIDPTYAFEDIAAKEALSKPHADGIQALLMRYLPDFCYQTSQEVCSMIEQVDEDITYLTVCVTLSRLVAKGRVHRRTVDPKWQQHVRLTMSRGYFPGEYARVSR